MSPVVERNQQLVAAAKPAVVLGVVFVMGACATSTPQPPATGDLSSGVEPVAPVEAPAADAETAAESETQSGAGGASASAKPVEHRIGKGEFPTPVLPEGIDGYAVPAIVSEPLPRYLGFEQGASEAESLGLVLTDPPKPKSRRGPGSVPVQGIEVGPAPANPNGAPAGIEVGDSPSPAAPAFTTVFGSLGFDDNSANAGSVFVPPDSSGAAGPSHVVSVVNVSIQFHTKAGTPLLDSVAGAPITGVSLASFFAPLAPLTATFDPKVIYDQHASRFVVVTLEQTDTFFGDPADTSRILLAVSDDADPTGTWFFTSITSSFPSSTTCPATPSWTDYPGFAVDEEAVYITGNLFGFFSFGAPFCGNRLWIVDKFAGAGGGFYGGGTATVGVFDPVPPGGFEGTTQPAHVFGVPSPAAPNVGTWLTLFSGLAAPPTEFLQVVRVDDPTTFGSTAFIGPTFVSLGNIDDLGAPLPDAPQYDVPADLAPSPPRDIETNDRRTLHSVWRDDYLYVTTTVDPEAGDPDDGDATAHWVKMDTMTLTGTPPPVPLVDQGGIGGEDIPDIGAADSKHTFFPSIAVSDSGEIAIGFSASGSSIHPGSYYTTHLPGSPAGSNTGSTALAVGVDEYVRTFDSAPCSMTPESNRWGDYSGAAIDPSDECFWIFNQHADLRGSGTAGGCNGAPAPEDGRWATTFGKVCGVCPIDVSLSGLMVSTTRKDQARDSVEASTVTVENGGELTFNSALVTLENGFTVETGGEFTVEGGPCTFP